MREVIIRFLSGALYVSIIFFTLFASREWFIGLLFILALITLNEFLRLISLKGYFAYLILVIAFYFISYKTAAPTITYSLLGISLIVNLFLLRDVFISKSLLIFTKRHYIYIIFYIIGGFIFLSLIPYINNIFEPKIIIGIFVLVWSNDTFAYLVGRSIGKRKLMEWISPKKTIEGFIGGMVGAIIASFFVFKYTALFNLPTWLLLAVLISILGTTGDLIQSRFKRLAGVKDSGKLMPGHGGIYDRLDSIIYASPFIYAFLIITNYVS